MKGLTLGYALCGSFCTISKAIAQIEVLTKAGANIIPIMSPIVVKTDTRFGRADERYKYIEALTGNKILSTITESEPIGPKALLDALIISPCTGNTLSKIALGITDSSVTMAAKAHLRNQRPLILGIATNDALSGSAANIGKLLNTKNIYFIPFGQDEAISKPTSMICDFEKTEETVRQALGGNQIQPILL